MPLSVIGSMTLGEICPVIDIAAGLMVSLSAQLDLSIFGPFGLGALQFDLSAQFSAALSLNASLSITVSNPIASFIAALAAIVQLEASISLAISLGIPTLGVEIGISLSASATLSASLGIKLGGIAALISGALAIKISIGAFIGALLANLSAGPVDLLSFGFDAPIQAAQVGSEAAVIFNGGLPGILPSANVFGIMLVTGSPSASIALGALFRTV